LGQNWYTTATLHRSFFGTILEYNSTRVCKCVREINGGGQASISEKRQGLPRHSEVIEKQGQTG